MRVSVLTPTCDRPIAFALTEKYIARQTRQPDEWIVADGGAAATLCTMGQIHVHRPRARGAANFANNLLNGIASATGDLMIVCEDDDWLRPDHIERMAAAAELFPLVGAEEIQNYYNVAHRCWRRFNNFGASMCQTAIRRELWPSFADMIRSCIKRNSYGIDTLFWRSVPREKWGIVGEMTVLGIKGLPGSAGLGIGHRPEGSKWVPDRNLKQLRAWIGADAALYESFQKELIT